MTINLRQTIDAAWKLAPSSPRTAPRAVRDAVAHVIAELDAGRGCASPRSVDGTWVTHQWVKKAVLLSFRLADNAPMRTVGRPLRTVPLLRQGADQVRAVTTTRRSPQPGVRVVPPAAARRGAYHRPQRRADAVVREHRRLRRRGHDGRHVGDGRLVRADRQERAPVRRRRHRRRARAAAGESDDHRGQLLHRRALGSRRRRDRRGELGGLGMGVFIGQSTQIYDRATRRDHYGRVPAGSVVVAGSLPAGGRQPPASTARSSSSRSTRRRAPRPASTNCCAPDVRAPCPCQTLKSRQDDIARMRVAGRLAVRAARLPRRRTSQPASRPARSTARARLHGRRAADDSGDAQLRAARPLRPYPASLCTSVNHVVCHGIPGDKKLKDGDIVNIDVTVIKDGLPRRHQPDVLRRRAVDPGEAPRRRHLRGDVARHPRGPAGRASRRHRPRRSRSFAEGHGFSIVREFCGHGIGQQFHEEPQVLHYGRAGHRRQAAGRA